MAAPETFPAPAPEPSEAEPVTAVQPVVPRPAPAEQEKGKKGKKGKDTAPAGADDGAPSVAAHPRAVRSIALAKGWGGLVGFLLAGYLSLPTSTLAGAAARALVAGVVCYVAAWGAAVFVWRRLVMLEIKAREQELVKAAEQAAERQLAAARAANRGAGAQDGP